MKRKDRYKIINYAKKEYSEIWECDFQFKHISLKEVKELLSTYKYSFMCKWEYCCYDLYNCCWQEPVFKGNWGMSQKDVNNIIFETFKDTAKQCRRDSRILYCEEDGDVNIIIIARDLVSVDHLITFSNKTY